jgi:putative methanogenesis marker protein 2
MDLNAIVDSVRNYEGVTRKKPIKKITNILNDVYNISGRVVLGFGDDASAIDIGNQKLLLLAADGMWGRLMQADPRWAGYCSVLVNVNDIAAMGGVPVGMVNVLSISNEEVCYKVMEGIKEGVEKFGIPMVGGHVHPDTPYDALDVSIAGIVDKDDVITSGDAKAGDKVIIAIDLDGQIHPKFQLNWDTTSHKSPELVQAQIAVMNKIGKKHLVTAGRDISNPGTLGTLAMLLEASSVGAIVELGNIPKNGNVPWDQWLKLYPGSGFVLTAEESRIDKCIEMLEDVNITSMAAGEIINDKKLYVAHNNDKKVVFDFKKDNIMGIKEKMSQEERSDDC